MKVIEILAERLNVGDFFVLKEQVVEVMVIDYYLLFNDRSTFRILVRECKHGENAEILERRIRKKKLVSLLQND